jgi:hypothetical protein
VRSRWNSVSSAKVPADAAASMKASKSRWRAIQR